MKKVYIFLKEFIRELPFLVVLGLLMFFAMGYGGVFFDGQDYGRNYIPINSEYGEKAYQVRINEELYGQEGFEKDKLGRVTAYNNVLYINRNILNIFEIKNKNLFTKDESSDDIREGLALKHWEDKYKLGDIISCDLSDNQKCKVKIVGYFESMECFYFYRSNNEKLIVFDHKDEITERVNYANTSLLLIPDESLDFYKNKYELYECLINENTVYEEFQNFISIKQHENKAYGFGVLMTIAAFMLVTLLYAFCKNDYYARKIATYNLFGETKRSRFIIESLKIFIVVLIPALIQYFAVINPIARYNEYWTSESTLNLIILLVVSLSYIVINMALNFRIFFRKNLKQIGE